MYSSEEQIIGHWIDGKPLYRKVFSLILDNTDGSLITTAIIANVDVIFADIVLGSDNDNTIFFSNNREDKTVNGYAVYFSKRESRFRLYKQGTFSPYNRLTIIAKYTKTI